MPFCEKCGSYLTSDEDCGSLYFDHNGELAYRENLCPECWLIYELEFSGEQKEEDNSQKKTYFQTGKYLQGKSPRKIHIWECGCCGKEFRRTNKKTPVWCPHCGECLDGGLVKHIGVLKPEK